MEIPQACTKPSICTDFVGCLVGVVHDMAIRSVTISPEIAWAFKLAVLWEMQQYFKMCNSLKHVVLKDTYLHDQEQARKLSSAKCQKTHYGEVIMGAIASQITSLTIVYSAVYSDADERKHQSSASLAFVRGIHRGPVNSPHKWPVTRKMFPFDDVIMPIEVQVSFGSGNGSVSSGNKPLPDPVMAQIYYPAWCILIASLYPISLKHGIAPATPALKSFALRI